jgi:23S rRNA (uracil1939-C5)-methyltransferase
VGRGCGGCQWQHITLAGQRALKTGAIEEVLRRQAGVELPPISPVVDLPAAAFRTTLRAAVAGGRAGYRRQRGHGVVQVEGCAVAHPLIEDLLVNGRFGSSSEVTLRCGARTGERLAAPIPDDTRIAVPADVRRDHVHEIAAGRRWRISAGSFFQSRPDGADALAALVGSAAGAAAPSGVAIDLYSGVGLFAGVLATAGWSVISVEASPDAVADAHANLADDDVNVVGADVNRWRAVAADLVVADPSRRGLGSEGVATVEATGASRVVLVSCDVGALGRDIALLRRTGFALTSVTPVDLFPHTFHVEVVSVLDR